MTRRFTGMGGHQTALGMMDEWLTPPSIIHALGGPESFDIDPCSPCDRPWDTASNHWTEEDDGLEMAWKGRVWLNPPYSQVGTWMSRLAGHGDGIALVFARTETDWFHDHVWDRATALFFFRRRITFFKVTGELSRYNAGAPSVLAAYNHRNALWLRQASLDGAINGRFLLL